jgi:hypothetical protein
MFGWTRIFTLVAVAAAVAIVAGGAGATSTSALAPATVAHTTSSGKVSTAASRRGTLLKTANLSNRAGVVRYLRAIGVDPRGLVIQRGARNYAGPNCPGAGWACTSTAHPVVQITAAGGRNTFFCTTGSCAVVQATTAKAATRTSRALTAAAAANTAKCNKTSGLMQSCVIDQTSATADNVAIVVERAKQASSVIQSTSAQVSADITQKATGSNNNQACVYQEITETLTPTNAKKGASVITSLEGQQSVKIQQDAAPGNNTVQNAAAPPATAACVSGPLTQTQTLTSRATGTAGITQNQNAGSYLNANVSLDIKQNQSPGYIDSATTTGQNTAAFSQTNVLTAIANTPGPSVSQTQSSPSGGIQASVNQFSHGLSTASATQSETQCEDAAPSGLVACSTTEHDPPFPPGLTQFQYGPVKNTGAKSPTAASRSLAFVRKDTGSIQSGNSQDTFTINQTSTQYNDTGANQTNQVQGACTTSGNCTVTQTTNVDGQTTTNTQSGQNVTTNITCTGTTCTKPTNINIVGNNAAFGGGPIQTYDFNTGALVNSFVPDGATIDSNNGRAVLVVGNEVFYTELCCGGVGATDSIRVAPFNGGAGGADIRTLPNPSSSGVQDLAFAGGALYALTGYSGGPLQVFKLDPTSGAVLGGPVLIAGSGQEASADGFAILPNGNFLINLGDTSCTYNEHDSTTGAVIGTSLTVPQASLCTGVETDGTSLYFQTDFNSFTQTDLAGNFIAKTTVQGNTVEDISLVGG